MTTFRYFKIQINNIIVLTYALTKFMPGLLDLYNDLFQGSKGSHARLTRLLDQHMMFFLIFLEW